MRQRGVLREHRAFDSCVRGGNGYEPRCRPPCAALKDVGNGRCCAKLAGTKVNRAETTCIKVNGNSAALGGPPAGAVPRLQMVLVAFGVRPSAVSFWGRHSRAAWLHACRCDYQKPERASDIVARRNGAHQGSDSKSDASSDALRVRAIPAKGQFLEPALKEEH
jgi:hypothetical protein